MRWILNTPAGPVELNESFRAESVTVGEPDTNAVARHAETGAVTPTGDGLTTPAPFILTGSVWRDDHNTPLILAEVDAITTAVLTCESIDRADPDNHRTRLLVHGGPKPVVTPDGLNGWNIEIELWPTGPDFQEA